MKVIRKIIALTLCICICCCTLSSCKSGGQSSSVASLPEETAVSPLDMVLTSEEQDEYYKYIDGIAFDAGVYFHDYINYYRVEDSIQELSKLEMRGVPVLITRSIDIEGGDPINGADREDGVIRDASGYVLSEYQAYTALQIMRADHYAFHYDMSDRSHAVSDNYYNFWQYTKEELPKIAGSEMTDAEKIEAYRGFGVFAAPYVKTEIENGNTGLEDFFALIGAHLSTGEYLDIIMQDTKAEDFLTHEEIDAMLISGAESFDWKAWCEETEEDLNDLTTFFDAYCAEYEANTATE